MLPAWQQFERPISVRQRAQAEDPGEEDMPAAPIGEIAIRRDGRPCWKGAIAFAAHAVARPAEHMRGREDARADLKVTRRLVRLVRVRIDRQHWMPER